MTITEMMPIIWRVCGEVSWGAAVALVVGVGAAVALVVGAGTTVALVVGVGTAVALVVGVGKTIKMMWYNYITLTQPYIHTR